MHKSTRNDVKPYCFPGTIVPGCMIAGLSLRVSIDPNRFLPFWGRLILLFFGAVIGLQKPDGYLRILGGNASGRFNAKLADPNNSSLAKPILIAGAEAGCDMELKEGIEAFMIAARNVTVSPLISGFVHPAVRRPKKQSKPKRSHANPPARIFRKTDRLMAVSQNLRLLSAVILH